MRIPHNNKSGFTLIEMIIVLVIFTTFTGFGVYIIQSVLTARHINDESMRDQIALRQALISITKDIRTNVTDSKQVIAAKYVFKESTQQIIRKNDDGTETVIADKVGFFISTYNQTDVNDKKIYLYIWSIANVEQMINQHLINNITELSIANILNPTVSTFIYHNKQIAY